VERTGRSQKKVVTMSPVSPSEVTPVPTSSSGSAVAAMEQRIARAKAEKQDAERAALRKKITDYVKSQGFDIRDLFGGRARLRGTLSRNTPIGPILRIPGREWAACRAGWPRPPKAARQTRKIS
jgi:hypothetical protein